jgi:hypothetical protein
MLPPALATLRVTRNIIVIVKMTDVTSTMMIITGARTITAVMLTTMVMITRALA